MLKILDTIRQANVESIKKYECHSCGRFEPTDNLEDRIVNDQGELHAVVVCKDCISHGWDEWRRD